MVKSREATSASVNIKEKKSLLDDEIGQDFLSSWNSMSVTQDDAMDFNYGTVLSGKEKTFNFDKLDMDFNLDADFNKFSSFKVDMPDLDFPCPSKKTAKPKERTEDSSTGNCKGKKDHFSFSFDFNDEDFANDVQFESNLFGSSESLTRELANDEPVFLESEKNVKEHSNIREDFSSDGVQNGSKVVSNFRPLDEQGLQGEPNLLSSEKNAGEDLHDNNAPIGGQLGGNSMTPTREIRDQEPGSPISEINVKNFSNIREAFNSDGSQLDGDLRSLNKQVIQNEPAMLRSEKNSGEDLHANDVQIGNQSRDNLKSVSSDLTEGEPVLLRSDNCVKNLSIIREAFESNGEQNGSKLVSNIRLQDKQSAIEESLMPGSENNTWEDVNTNDAQVGKKLVVLDSLSRELTETEPVLEESKKNDKNLSNIREGINNDGVQVSSKFGDNSRCQEKEANSGKPTQLRSDKSSMEDLRANDVQIRNQSMDNSKSVSSDLTEGEPVLLRSDNSIMNLSNIIREAFVFDGEQNGGKLGSNIRLQDKQATKEECVMPVRENNTGEGFNTTDAQVGKKLVVLKSISRELTKTEPILEESKKNNKSLSNVSRKGVNTDGLQVGSKFGGNSKSEKKERTIARPVHLRSDKSSMEDLRANDVQSRNQLVDNSKSVSSDLTEGELGLLRSDNRVKNLSNIREAFESDGEQNGSKLVSNIRLQNKQAANEESVMPGRENNTGEGFNTNNAQVGKNGVVLKSLSKELTKTEPISDKSKKNDKSLNNIRKGMNIDGVQVGSKFGGNSRSQKKETTIAKPVQLRSDKSSIFQASPSSQTEKIAKSTTQTSGNPKFVISSLASIRNLKNHSAEGHKIGKRTPELSSLKNLRTAGANRDIPNSTVLRRNNSLRNLEQNTKLASSTTSKIACPVDEIDKQKPPTPSLKRKISEESNVDLVSLKPLKRLSVSPKESRSFRESSGEVEEETCNNENQSQSRTKNVLYDQPTSRLEDSEEINMTELGIPFVVENDGNVEKAEAYMKGLEDICNMLKKKHEEAKEVLVRAIVNNNNLLILNHPIYEEKIRMVQDFATQLTLKEIPVDR